MENNSFNPNQQPPNPVPSQVSNSKNSKIIPIGLGVIVVLIVATGAYLLGTKQTQPVVQNTIQTTPIPSPSVAIDVTANWKTYTNEKYGFSFQYPTKWNVQLGKVYNEPYSGEITYFMTCSTSTLVLSLFDLNRPDAVYKSLDEYLKKASRLTGIKWEDKYVAGAPGKYDKEIGEPGSVTPSATVVLFNRFKNSIIDLYFTDPCGNGIDIDQAIKNEFDQILSTFQFTQ